MNGNNNRRSMYVAIILIAIILLTLVTVYASATVGETLRVSARSAVLYQPDTDRFIYTKNADERMPMASTTKIMTALVVIDSVEDITETVTVCEDAAGTEGSSAYLKAGDELTVEELLYALLLQSANDAAVALAHHVGGDVAGFSAMMNERALEMGLTDTHFTNPHGLDDEEHYTTARDLARIGAAALENELLRSIASTYKRTFKSEERTRTYVNHNKLLLRYDGAIGIKTGYTKRCGRCLVGAAERDGLTLVSVTLDAPSDWSDHSAMLDYGYERLERIALADVYKYKYDLPVLESDIAEIRVTNVEELGAVLPRGEHDVKEYVKLPRFLTAPVHEGEIVGSVSFTVDGEYAGCVDIVATENVKPIKKDNLLKKIFGLFK